MMTYKTAFSVTEYALIVENIAEGYFDDNGEYAPHIGKLNTMAIFYNDCVLDNRIDISTITEVTEMDALITDDNFIESFNNAITFDGKIKLNFANAYRDALDIIETKKSSINYVADKIKTVLVDTFKKAGEIFSGDNIGKLQALAESFSKGNLNVEAIEEAIVRPRPKKE